MENDYKKELQKKLLEMMVYLDQFCKENGIEYYIAGGNALGAVRHQGFIPWDDDFDIMMTMENYEKFTKACQTKLDKKYSHQSIDTDPNYHLNFSKIRDNTTTFIEDGSKQRQLNNYGVYVDIFQISGVPEGKLARKMQNIYRTFAIACYIPHIIHNKAVSTMLQMLCKLLGRRVQRFLRKKAEKYSCEQSKQWYTVYDAFPYHKCVAPKEYFGKPTYVPYENSKLPIPEKAHEYLTIMYGDYMQIPSPEEIKKMEHKPYVLDTKRPFTDYLVDGRIPTEEELEKLKEKFETK